MSAAGASGDRLPRVLVWGDRSGDDFAALNTELAASGSPWDVVWCDSFAALQSVEEPPEIVVVLQSFPDEHSARQVNRLLNQFPLSRLIVAYGAWCDSIGRTRDVWPTSCRVPASGVVARLRHEIDVVSDVAAPLPLTANRDETWLYDRQPIEATNHHCLRVAVLTPDPAIGDWLSVAIEAAGHVVHRGAPVDADVLLQDVDPWTPRAADALTAYAEQAPELAIVAVTGFERPHDEQQMCAAGALTVLTKLSSLVALQRTVETAGRRHPRKTPQLRIASPT